MTLAELQRLLALLQPDIVEVHGRLLLRQSEQVPSRITAATQREHNRRFIVADVLDPLLQVPLRISTMNERTEAIIVGIANQYASALQTQLSREFPGYAVTVEVIGADAVDDEPLEVAVTFFQSAPACSAEP